MAAVPSRLATLPSVVFGSATARTQELIAADTALRVPLPLCRRIGIVQLRGGAGASTVASSVAATLARRRSGMVLGVNASAGVAPMFWSAGLPGSAQQRDDAARSRPRRAADAVAGLPTTPSGFYAYDLVADDNRGIPAPPTLWSEQVSPISRFFDAIVTDWGVRPWQLDLALAAASSHVICLVARADRHAAEEAASVIPALLELEDRPGVVLALVDVGDSGARTVSRIVADAGAPVIWMPFDSARGRRRPVGSRALSTGSRIAVRMLTTTLLAAGADR